MPTARTAAAPERRVRELTRLHRAGALRYHGLRGTNQYDVTAAGTDLTLHEEEVLGFAARVHALHELRPAGVALTATNKYTFTVRVGRKRSQPVLDELEVLPWADGFNAAIKAGDTPHAGKDGMQLVGGILTKPGLADQCRLYLVSVMAAEGVTQEDLARRAGIATVKTISKALEIGSPRGLLPAMADRLAAALDKQLLVSGAPLGGKGVPDRVPPPYDVPEHPAWANLRGLHAAQAAGWLLYQGPSVITKARTAHRYEVTVGGDHYWVKASETPAWLRGLAAAHGQVS